MGNRAVVAFEALPTVGVYVHWNGGLGSVLAFLEATKRRGARSPAGDPTYAFARFVQTVGDFFERGSHGELNSIGVGPIDQLDADNGDNGLYWIGPDWSIVKREHTRGGRSGRSLRSVKGQEREQYEGILETLLAIDVAREAAHKKEGR